jgi:hypothetical protein
MTVSEGARRAEIRRRPCLSALEASAAAGRPDHPLPGPLERPRAVAHLRAGNFCSANSRTNRDDLDMSRRFLRLG